MFGLRGTSLLKAVLRSLKQSFAPSGGLGCSRRPFQLRIFKQSPAPLLVKGAKDRLKQQKKTLRERRTGQRSKGPISAVEDSVGFGVGLGLILYLVMPDRITGRNPPPRQLPSPNKKNATRPTDPQQTKNTTERWTSD